MKKKAQSQYTISGHPPLPSFLYPQHLVSVGQVRPIGWGAELFVQSRLGGRALWLE